MLTSLATCHNLLSHAPSHLISPRSLHSFLFLFPTCLLHSLFVFVIDPWLGRCAYLQDYFQEIREEYSELRAQHLKAHADHKYVPLAKARARALQLPFAAPHPPPAKPGFTGARVFTRIPLRDLVPYIDWNPFFQVWQLRGKYPNRNYPKLFNDATVGEQAKVSERISYGFKISLINISHQYLS